MLATARARISCQTVIKLKKTPPNESQEKISFISYSILQRLTGYTSNHGDIHFLLPLSCYPHDFTISLNDLVRLSQTTSITASRYYETFRSWVKFCLFCDLYLFLFIIPYSHYHLKKSQYICSQISLETAEL